LNSGGIGPKTFWDFLRKYKTAGEALKKVRNPCSLRDAERLLANFDGKVLLAIEKSFPQELKSGSHCPPLLFYKGNVSLFQRRKIAIIGARNASINGRSMAELFGRQLSSDFAVVSGLAKGIDTSAHVGALKNNGATIAVLPFSIDNIYPKENEPLYKEIVKKGLVISEVIPQKIPDQGMFPSRNRLIATFAECIIVIEAALKSGTLSTALTALDIGKDIFVVPGSPCDPRYSGSNFLIKNGAPLIENCQDVLSALKKHCNDFSEQYSQTQFFEVRREVTNVKVQKVITALSDVPIPIDLVAKRLMLNVKDVLSIISELEIKKIVAKTSQNEVFLVVPNASI
jgi:DNA processing protein